VISSTSNGGKKLKVARLNDRVGRSLEQIFEVNCKTAFARIGHRLLKIESVVFQDYDDILWNGTRSMFCNG
jgi:hypothetical protein